MITSMRAIGLMTNGMTKEDIYIMPILAWPREIYFTSQASSSVANSVDPEFGQTGIMMGSMKENSFNKNHTGMELLNWQTEVSTKETGITARNMVKGN